MKTVKKLLIALLLILFGAAVSYFITSAYLRSVYSAQIAAMRAERSPAERKAAELTDYIETYFVGEYDEETLADASAEALIKATGDRWSYYISEDEYESYLEQMQNAYVGIGVTIQLEEESGKIRIIEVTPGGPAFEAGILVDDYIVGVNGESVIGMTTTEVRERVRGEEGTTVSLEMERGGAPLTLEVERRTIYTAVASGELLDGGIAYIKIRNFDENCAAHTIGEIERLIGEGATSLLFDVRNNPGGYKKELVTVLDYLLPEGPLFRMKTYDGQELIDVSDASCVELPMVVLVNEDSYSAAEFFAAALREYGAADIVGGQTCGKGYYQNTYMLSDGSAVALSSGTYYTPKEVSLAGVGLTPDLAIEIDDETYAKLYYDQLPMDEDEQLQGAIGLLTK